MSSIDPIRPVGRSPYPQPLRRREREQKGECEPREEPREEAAVEEDGPTPSVDLRA